MIIRKQGNFLKLVTLLIILSLLTAVIPNTALSADSPDSALLEFNANSSIINSFNVSDCPDYIDNLVPDRTVMQIINNTFYKWYEYDIGQEGAFCILQEKPFKAELTESEAVVLLTMSQSWQMQAGLIEEEAEIIDVSEARLSLPSKFRDLTSEELDKYPLTRSFIERAKETLTPKQAIISTISGQYLSNGIQLENLFAADSSEYLQTYDNIVQNLIMTKLIKGEPSGSIMPDLLTQSISDFLPLSSAIFESFKRHIS